MNGSEMMCGITCKNCSRQFSNGAGNWDICEYCRSTISKPKLIGRKHPPSRKEIRFWDIFPGLLFDDPEEESNELINILRITAEHYFKEMERKSNE